MQNRIIALFFFHNYHRHWTSLQFLLNNAKRSLTSLLLRVILAHTLAKIGDDAGAFILFKLRSNHLVQTVRTTFPVVQTVPFTFPLGISHLHLWRSGDGFSDSVCTAGKKMASLHIKPYIIALQLQLCTWREPSYSRIRPLPMRWSGGGGC